MSLLVGVLLGILSMLGYALSDFFGTIASRKVGWFEAATVSRAASFLVLLFLLILFFKIPSISFKDSVLIVTAGVLSAVGIQLFYKSIKVSILSITAPISDSSSAITLILLLIVFSNPLNLLEKISIFLILSGAILSSFKYQDLKNLKIRKFTVGAELAALSSLAFGLSVFIEIVLVKDIGWFIPAFFIYLVILFYNLTYSSIFKIKFKKIANLLKPASLAGLAAAAAFLIFNYAVTLNYSIIVTPLAGASTVVSVILGLFIFREKLEINQKIGVLLIVMGIIILSLI